MNKDNKNEHYFSDSYAEARRRFLDATTAVDAKVHSYNLDLPSSDELAIDVAIAGPVEAPALVISSGVHGVEGFFGSAVQLALLERLQATSSQKNIRYVLIHSINPFGFAHLRRVNEDNVDLNRNFMTNSNDYTGAPDGYAQLNGLLNPQSTSSGLDLFKLRVLWNIWRQGLPTLKKAVAVGQYEYPQGLFFGGKEPAKSTQIIQKNCDSWLPPSQQITHIDLHTGLGPFGTYKLLLTESPKSKLYSWYADTFGAENIEPLAKPDGTAYTATGMFALWLKNHFQTCDYRLLGAEFGTYDVIKVLEAMRAENRAHHYYTQESSFYKDAKKKCLECFCPESPLWRRQVIDSALQIIDQGTKALTV